MADDARFRFTTPKSAELPITLEPRHARDAEWEAIGAVTDASLK